MYCGLTDSRAHTGKYFAAGMLVLGRHTMHMQRLSNKMGTLLQSVREASYEKLVMRSVNYAVRS